MTSTHPPTPLLCCVQVLAVWGRQQGHEWEVGAPGPAGLTPLHLVALRRDAALLRAAIGAAACFSTACWWTGGLVGSVTGEGPPGARSRFSLARRPPPPSCLPAALSPAAARRAWLTAVTTDGLTPAAFAQLAAQPPVQAPPAEASRGGGLGVAPQEEEEREGAEEWWEEGEGQQYPGTPGLAVPASPTRAPLTATPRRAGTVPAPTTPVL